MSQLKVIREAMELFAVAFRDIFPQITQVVDRYERRFFPAWILYVIEDPAVQQDSWSRIVEFSDPSPGFQRAIQKLKTKGLDIEADKGNASRSSGVYWTCKFDENDVCAYLHHDVEADTVNGIQFDLRTLFNAGVPLILLQLGHSPSSGIWQNLQQQVRMEVDISIALHDLTTENSRGLAAGLTRIPINALTIMFDNETKTSEVINAGILMNRAYDWYRVVSDGDMWFKCEKESKNVFAAICLTIAAQMQTPILFSLGSVDSESWPWLLNAICCGIPTKVSIWDATLTKSDLLGVADALR